MNRAAWHKVFEQWLSRGELAQRKDLPKDLIIPDDLMKKIRNAVSKGGVLFVLTGEVSIEVQVPGNGYPIGGYLIISTEEALVLVKPKRRLNGIEAGGVEFVPWDNISSIRIVID